MTDETKTTPGPWVWRGKDGGLYQEGTPHRFGEPVLVPSYEYDSGIDTIVSEADMALIAAAPEMLAALKFIASHDLGGTGVAQGVLQSMKTIAKEAMAKAEGHSK